MAQQQDPLGKPQGIIRTMQQDIDRAQGRGGDAFEDIASASPLPTQTPQESPEEMLGMDIPMPDAPPPPAPKVFEPMPSPAPAPAPAPAPVAPSPAPTPATPAAPALTDEELDALLPLGNTPAPTPAPAPAPAPGTPATPAPGTPPAPTPETPDFGSLTRRVVPTPETPSVTTNKAPSALPMDDIAPAPSPRVTDPENVPLRTQSGATPPPNLPIGNGPQGAPSAPPPPAPKVFEPMPSPAPAPMPIPPFGTQPQQGLEEGEEVPAQTPEELLGFGLDEDPNSIPTPETPIATSPEAPLSSDAPDSEKPVFVEEKTSLLSSRATIIASAGLFVATLAGTLAYFFFFAGTKQEPILNEPTPPPAQEEVIVPPSPLITPDRMDEISIARLSTQALQAALTRIQEEDLPPSSITYLPVRLTEGTSDGKEQYLTAQLFFTTLGIALPEEFLATIDPTFMLYAYGPGEEEETVCATEATARTTCPGPRLGIILQAREGQEESTAALVAAWTALDMSTFEALILDEATLPTATTFQQSTYASAQTETTGTIPVYYANLPHSATALNFAVVPGGKIVIGTSKNSLYTALDTILESQ